MTQNYDQNNNNSTSDLNNSNIGMVCRICLGTDTGSESGRFLQPCNCKGSIQQVHSNCLKKSILLSTRGMEEAIKCDLCQEKFKMVLKFRRNKKCTKIARRGLGVFISITSLISVWMIVQVLLTIYIIFALEANLDQSKEYEYTADHLWNNLVRNIRFLCIFIAMTVAAFRTLSVKNDCLDVCWNIYNKTQDVPKDKKLLSKLELLKMAGYPI